MLKRVRLLGSVIEGGTAAWTAVVNTGIALTNLLTARLSEVNTGIAVAANIFAPRIAQTPAFAVSTTVQGETHPAVNPGLALAPRINSAVAASQVPAYDIQQVQLNLVRLVGGVTATITGPGWTNQANAQGVHNAGVATNTGAALDPAIATLKVNYADNVDKTGLTITQVRLIFYSQLNLSAVLAPPTRFDWSKDNGSNWTNLQQVTTDYNDLAAGRAFVLPALTWAELDAFEARMTIDHPALSALTTLTIDAIELEITAALTWAL